MARIKVIQHDEAEGRLKQIYNNIIKKRGKLAEVHKIQSLRPESIIHHMDLYLEVMFTKSDLSRAEREMMAVVVSLSNGCEYCRLHHAEALNHYWRNEEKLSLLITDFSMAGLSSKEFNLCEFARDLTLKPDSFNEERSVQKLKDKGFTDSAILDATLVVSYFNFVNRIVLAMGVESDKEELTGYNF